jgi:pimeloyl-ACP methyl ester carboxylesterase/heat shock protein HslJ
MLLAACSVGKITVTVEPTFVAPQPTSTTEPTTAPSPTVAAPAPTSAPDEALVMLQANPWQWVGFTNPVEQYSIDNPQNYVLNFNEDGTVNIVADCNNASGSYTTDGSSISIQVGPMTMAACPPESHSDDFIKYLGFAAIYFYQDGNLYIDLMADGGTLALSPAGEAGMAGPGENIQTGDLPRYEPVEECFVVPPEDLDIKFDMECGYVVVPEFYNGESTRELKLGVTRLKSSNGTAVSPLFMLLGGPGQSFESDYFRNFQPEILGNILEERDIILLSQRGTKNTDTFLDCPEYYSLSWVATEQGLDPEAFTNLETETLQNCIDGFKAQGIDLNAYNSVENAADVNASRQALGYDKIIYYGASYGSILGQHVMRDFPEMLEAVVLDGASPLSRKSWVEDRALDAQWGIDNLTALCNADEKCSQAYDIPALLEATAALFAEGPLTFRYTHPDAPSISFDLEMTEAGLFEVIHGQQGSGIGAFSLPAFLWQLSQEGGAALEGNLVPALGGSIVASRDITEGEEAFLMHLAMVCSDDRVKSMDEVKIEGVGEYARVVGQSLSELYALACPLLDVQELPDATDENVTLDVPTLLLAGDLDIATPTFRTQQVADALPNDTFVIFPGRTHVQLNGANQCAGRIMTQFVLDPTAPLDTSCAKEPSPYSFILPDGSPSK